MKGSAFILFCASLVAVALSDEVELNAKGCPVDFKVHKVLAHDTYCNLFYSCVGGDRVEQRCAENLVFNVAEDVCDWSYLVDCGGKGIFEFIPDTEEDKEEVTFPGGNSDPSLATKICAEQGSEGIQVAHENCTQFYVCERRTPIALECPEGLYYNYDLAVCDWPANVKCGDRIVPEPKPAQVLPEDVIGDNQSLAVFEACAKDDTNELLIAHENCNRFYKCSFGVPVAFSCPAGLVYNIEKHYCDWQENVQCGNRTIVEDEVVKEDINDNVNGGHGHTDPSEAPAICAAEKSDGVLVAHENCNQFYKCWNRTPVSLNCPLNLLYNAELEICDWPKNVDCGTRVKSSRRLN